MSLRGSRPCIRIDARAVKSTDGRWRAPPEAWVDEPMAHDDDGPEIEIADEGTEVMPPEPAAEPGGDLAGHPEDNPVVAETRRIRADEVVVKPALPFESPLQPERSGPTPEELDEIVWKSKVGIDPSDLPSAQLVVPPSERQPKVDGDKPAHSHAKLGVLLLVAALLVGFAVTALAIGW